MRAATAEGFSHLRTFILHDKRVVVTAVPVLDPELDQYRSTVHWFDAPTTVFYIFKLFFTKLGLISLQQLDFVLAAFDHFK